MAEKKSKQLDEHTPSGALAQVAQSPPVQAPVQRFRLLGRVDQCDVHGIAGWLAMENELRPLAVELFVDGQAVARMPADQLRPDLAAAGIGAGKHGFMFSIPAILNDGNTHIVSVKEASTGTDLPGSPKTVTGLPSATVVQADNLSFGKLPVIGEGGQVIESGIMFDQMIGPMSYGWSIPGAGDANDMFLSLGNMTLGKITAHLPRPDVQAAAGVEGDAFGYELMTGGLLQYSALTTSIRTAALIQSGSHGKTLAINLKNYFDQSYTFAPLMGFSRNGKYLGKMSSASCSPDGEFTVLFEAGAASSDADNLVRICFYQEKEEGHLTRLDQFNIPLTGQLARLQITLLSTEKPLLVVASGAAYDILLTDCFLYPALYFDKHAPLVEYHSLLANGQSAFDVIAKIARNHLDFWTDKHLGRAQEYTFPTRERTAVLVFCPGDLDLEPHHIFPAFAHLSEQIAFIDRRAMVLVPGAQEWQPLKTFLDTSPAEHYLVCESANVVRPDFWSIFSAAVSRSTTPAALLYWESIWIDGANRPLWVKNDIPAGEAFVHEELVPVGAAMFSRQLMGEIGSTRWAALVSAEMQLPNVISAVKREKVRRLPVVMDIRRLPLSPAMIFRMHMQQQEFPQRRPEQRKTGNLATSKQGVSVIINYRNSAPVTIECLKSLRLQDFVGPIEIILIDNGSTQSNSMMIHSEAERIFGKANVKLITYSGAFNHSAQCNLAAQQASHDYLFMLSNDSILISRDAIARAVRIASTQNVGTTGFRIVKAHGESQKLVSLGLTLSSNKYVFAGAAPLSTHRPPQSLLQYTQGANGNTFAAVMLRKSVYNELGGLDEREFPTDYNDVDFCLRATSAGYTHVTIGSSLISHNGRGSREMNLDLPINPLLISRTPALATLLQSFSVKLL
jgi:GT2 family glycosyltransferase